MRDYLVRHQDISFDEYANAFSLAFDVSWPYDESLIVQVDETTDSATNHCRLNPIFEEHIRNINNWTVGSRYWQLYPVLAKAVEEDRRQFGVDTRKFRF